MSTLTLALLACTEADEAPPHFDAPDSPGSFDAVTYELDQTWQVWYPSLEGRGTESAEYDDLLRGDAWSQGDVACDQTRPVVVFSHGHRGIRWQSIHLTEALARHGYVVIAPDHEDNTFMDGDGDTTPTVAARRPGEVRASFERLLDEERFEGCIDPDGGYAVAGHSFGAFTALAVAGAGIDVDGLTAHCADDPDDIMCGAEELLAEAEPIADERVWASVPITPGGATAFGDRVSELDVPILVIAAGGDTTTPVDEDALPIYNGLTTETRYLGLFPDAGHFTFTDICMLLADFNGCGEGYVDQTTAQEVGNTLVLALLAEARGFDTQPWWTAEHEVAEVTAGSL